MLLSAVAICAGCGGKQGTVPVYGKVTLDGQPYTLGGSVILQPEAGGKMSTAPIEPDGSYEVGTYTRGDGALPGDYKVSVIPAPPDIGDEVAAQPQTSASTIPIKYANVETSDLRLCIAAGQATEYEISLQSR